MLPPFIIDQIRRREEDEKRPAAPMVELELPLGPGPREPKRRDDEPQRGVIIIDLG
jgi:hypothetical protein